MKSPESTPEELGSYSGKVQSIGGILNVIPKRYHGDLARYSGYTPTQRLDLEDPHVKGYLQDYHNIQVDTGKVGRYIQITQLPNVEEFQPLVSPVSDGDFQGDANVRALKVANLDAIYIPLEDSMGWLDAFVEDHPDMGDEEKKALETSWKGVESRTIEAPNAYLDNQEILGEVEPGEETPVPQYREPARTRYGGESIVRRRPPGDFFMVDMVSPSRSGLGNPERVDILAQDGNTIISSLQLNMSPQSLSLGAAKKISRAQTMTRWLEEHWGDEMDQISFNGTTFAFIQFPSEQDEGGLCVSSRRMTSPYQELQHLINIYKYNGCVFQGEALASSEVPRQFFNYNDPMKPYLVRRHPRVGLIKHREYIRLSCDIAQFIGFFESFDVVEDAQSPFNFKYSVSFRAEHTRWL